MTRRKVVLIILDGLGDLPAPAFDGRTPLEAAETPVLDALARSGECGLVDPIAPGVYVDTQTGAGALMGMAPQVAAPLRRGPVEAAGIGVELKDGEVALRGNFATLNRDGDGFDVRDRRAGRIRDGAAELADALNTVELGDEDVSVSVRPLRQHRFLLHLSGPSLSDDITDTDPGTTGVPQVWRPAHAVSPGNAAAERTARAVNEFSRRAYDVLAAHPVNEARRQAELLPANGVLLRGAGCRVRPHSVLHDRGLSGAVVTADRTLLGLGVLLGFTPVLEPGFTGLTDTDLDAKVAATLSALDGHDIVWLHIKGPDIAAHDRDAVLKARFLERVDAALGPLCEHDAVLAVAADHTTDSNTGCHTGDPVPALIRTPDGAGDPCAAFSERVCRLGGLGRLTASQYLDVVLAAATPTDVSGAARRG